MSITTQAPPKMNYMYYYELLAQFQDQMLDKHRKGKITTDRMIFLASKINEWSHTWDEYHLGEDI